MQAGGHRRPQQLFAHDCEENSSSVRSAAMFEQENALPRSELHSPIDNRHGLAGARQHHADVRRHVVAAFRAVREVIGVFWNQTVKERFQVAARSGIGIFHDNQAATGVLNKYGHRPIAHAALVDLGLDRVRDFVRALTVRAKFELIVMHIHAAHVIQGAHRSKTRGAGIPRRRIVGEGRRSAVDLSVG